MERDQILRDDFPSVRKGWDPDAVRSHLRAVADSAPAGGGTSLADGAAERVRIVIAAAEELATEISAEAQSDAERILTEARAEAEQLVADAREQADARVEQARAAVGGLVAQADDLRAKVGTLGEELTGSIRASTASIGAGAGAARAEVPGPVIVPEPTPPTIPEPTPDPVPEPMPDPVPEPTPAPTPEPMPDGPGLADAQADQSPALEPDALPPAAEGEVSTEDLIAQLRSAGDAKPTNGSAPSGAPAAPAVSDFDQAAARLVAMNMALDGSSRDAIAAKLRADFGDGVDLEGVLDDVLARAAR